MSASGFWKARPYSIPDEQNGSESRLFISKVLPEEQTLLTAGSSYAMLACGTGYRLHWMLYRSHDAKSAASGASGAAAYGYEGAKGPLACDCMQYVAS